MEQLLKYLSFLFKFVVLMTVFVYNLYMTDQMLSVSPFVYCIILTCPSFCCTTTSKVNNEECRKSIFTYTKDRSTLQKETPDDDYKFKSHSESAETFNGPQLAINCDENQNNRLRLMILATTIYKYNQSEHPVLFHYAINHSNEICAYCIRHRTVGSWSPTFILSSYVCILVP